MNSQDRVTSPNRRFFGILISLVFLVIAGFFLSGEGIVEGATLYVDDDAAEGGNGSLDMPFNTIQDAVNASENGDTIRVFNGTYLENVVVNVTVSLIGNGSDETVIDGMGKTSAVSIESNGVTVSNVTMTHATYGIIIESYYNNSIRSSDCSNNFAVGIRLTDSNNNTIMNNICTSTTRGIQFHNSSSNIINGNNCSSNSEYGIYFHSSHWNTVKSNTCSRTQKGGIRTFSSENNTFKQNTGYYNSGSNNEYGISIDGSNNTIHNNTFDFNDEGAISASGTNHIITNNSCRSNTHRGIHASGSFLIINNNHCSGNYIGILLDRVKNSSVENNSFSDNDNAGLFLSQAEFNSIRNNTITNNRYGIETWNSVGNQVHFNDILMNTEFGIDASENGAKFMEASNNWWGEESGPYHELKNPSGRGDNITNYVHFEPWIGIRTYWFVQADAPANGDGSYERPYRTIQEAVNSASDTHTIRVYEGTYFENVVLNRTVNVIGNGTGNTTIDANTTGDVITITSDSCNITGFNVTGSGENPPLNTGIRVESNGNTIHDNLIIGNPEGIQLIQSSNNMILNNSIRGNNETGIYVFDGSNWNIVRGNDISENGYGIVVQTNSMNNTIDMNTFTLNADSGIAINGFSDFNSIHKNHIDRNEAGIELGDVKNITITETNITDADQTAIEIDRSENITLWGLLLSGNEGPGIDAVDVTVMTIRDITIENTATQGIDIETSESISIIRTIIRGSGDGGFRCDETTDLTIVDSNLTSNINSDIALDSTSDGILTNTSYDDVNVGFGSSIEVWWTFELMVMDENGSALEGARVVLMDVNWDEVFNGTTDVNGTIPLLNVHEGNETSLGMDSLNPHTIDISKDGLKTVNESLTVDSFKDLDYSLLPPPPPPEAKVAHNLVLFIDETLNVNLDASPSTGDGLSYLWTFEDNSTSDQVTVSHGPYDKAGIYIINLTVTDGEMNDSLEIRVVVSNIAPTNAEIIGGDKTGKEDQTIVFAGFAVDTDTLTYTWDFGDGTYGVGQNPTHKYTNQGNYTVNLTVTDDDGAVAYAEIFANITNRAPEADGSSLNAPQPPGKTIYFTAEDSTDPDASDRPLLQYSWDFGDGSENATGMFVSHAYSAPGTYTVNLTVTDDNDAFNVDSFDVEVENQNPVAVPGDDISVREGDNFTLNGDGSYDPDDPLDWITNWTWDMDDGTILYGEEITHHYDTMDNYTVTLTVTDTNGTEHFDVVNVTVLNDLPYNLSIQASNDTIEQGMTVNFTGSANDTETLTYSWDFGDGNVSEGMEVNHTFVHTGTLTVTMFVTDGMDTVNTTIEIEVTNIAPNASFTPGKTEADVGEEITFIADDGLDVAGEELTYNWKFGDDNTATGREVKHTYTTSGTMTVELTVIDAALDVSDPFEVDITINNQKPTPRISVETNTTKAGDTMVFDGSASSDPTGETLSYTWDFGDNTTLETKAVVVHTFTKEGTYTVTLTVSDGDNSEETTVLVTVTKADKPSTPTEEDGLDLITLVALILVIILAIMFVILLMFSTDKKPGEFGKVMKMMKEGKTAKDLSPGGGDAAAADGAAVLEGVEAVEVEAVEGEVISGEAMEAALVAGVVVAGAEGEDDKEKKGKKDVKLIDEEVDEFTAKKASYQFFMQKLERERGLLSLDLEKEQSESRKKETERQLQNIEEKIMKQSEKIKKLEEEAEEARKRKEAEAAAAAVGAGGAVVAGVVVGGPGAEFDEEAVAASVPKPEAIIALEMQRDAVDRLHPASDNELERKRAELEAYADYADDPDYAEYVADLQTKVNAMEAFVKKREKSGKGSGFPLTSEVAVMHGKIKTIKAKGKKGASKKEIAEVQDLEKRINAFEGMIGQSMDELLDELYAEAVEGIEAQIAEEEAAWEDEKAAAVETARAAHEAQLAKAAADEAAKSGEVEGAEPAEAEALDAEPAEAEAVEADAVEAEVETEAVEAEVEAAEVEGVEEEVAEVEGVEVEGVEVEAAEVEGVELEGVEVEAAEVEGVEVEGVEIEGVEVEGVELEGVEIEEPGKDDKKSRHRKKKAKTGKEAKAAAAAAGAGVAAAAGTKPDSNKVTCPQCSTQLAVGTDKRPFTFGCPKCGRRITLEAKPGEAAGKPGAAAPGSQVTCPRCRTSMNVATTQRPFTFNCPKCAQRITLQSPGKGGPQAGPQTGMPAGYPPQGQQIYQQPYGQQYPQQARGAPGTMNCPRCRATLDVSRMPRPSTFNCPHCQTRIDLR